MTFLEISVLLVASVLTVSSSSTPNRDTQKLSLILDEQFDTLDLSLWQHEITLGGGGNWEFQYYLNNRTSSYVKDGALYIQPILHADEIGEANVRGGWYNLNIWGSVPGDYCTSNPFYGCERTSGAGGNYLNPVKSARLRTAYSFAFKYGKVEVRAKLPRGDWLWPAIWMLPRDNQYGNWPVSGEIDIMESRGNVPPYPPGGYDHFSSTLHWGPYWNQNAWSKTTAQKNGTDFTADFHIYGFLWNETYMGTYLDTEDNPVLQVPIIDSFWQMGGWPSPPWANPWESGEKNAPFDREFFLIINVACGGTNGYFPDGYGKPWNNTDGNAINKFYDAFAEWNQTWTQPMIVDSVQVWSYMDIVDKS